MRRCGRSTRTPPSEAHARVIDGVEALASTAHPNAIARRPTSHALSRDADRGWSGLEQLRLLGAMHAQAGPGQMVHEDPRTTMDRGGAPRGERGLVPRARVALVARRSRSPGSARPHSASCGRASPSPALTPSTPRGTWHRPSRCDARWPRERRVTRSPTCRRRRSRRERRPVPRSPDVPRAAARRTSRSRRTRPATACPTDHVRHHPAMRLYELLAFRFGQRLRVAHLVHPSIPREHRGADRQRAGPRATPHLVDADDHVVTLIPERALDPERGRPGPHDARAHRNATPGEPATTAPIATNPAASATARASGDSAASSPPDV